MKIFEITFTKENEKAWIYAKSLIDCIKTYLRVTGASIGDFSEDDDIAQIPKEKWHEYTVLNTDNEDELPMTFDSWVLLNDGFSDLIAVTSL